MFIESPHRNSVQEALKAIDIVDSDCFGYSQVVELILALRTDCWVDSVLTLTDSLQLAFGYCFELVLVCLILLSLSSTFIWYMLALVLYRCYTTLEDLAWRNRWWNSMISYRTWVIYVDLFVKLCPVTPTSNMAALFCELLGSCLCCNFFFGSSLVSWVMRICIWSRNFSCLSVLWPLVGSSMKLGNAWQPLL